MQNKKVKIDSSTATIREVYEVTRRIEDKIDRQSQEFDNRFSNLEQRVANIEGRATVIAIAWSTVVSLGAVVLESMWHK